ncbi:hypothetical protein Z950_2988 [Sulfitobacter mediterraneus KCTC 32188]|nr:hypothetical protein Z950_2988 [Sulfitobacter mediterraneus KCTC 32188]
MRFHMTIPLISVDPVLRIGLSKRGHQPTQHGKKPTCALPW